MSRFIAMFDDNKYHKCSEIETNLCVAPLPTYEIKMRMIRLANGAFRLYLMSKYINYRIWNLIFACLFVLNYKFHFEITFYNGVISMENGFIFCCCLTSVERIMKNHFNLSLHLQLIDPSDHIWKNDHFFTI